MGTTRGVPSRHTYARRAGIVDRSSSCATASCSRITVASCCISDIIPSVVRSSLLEQRLDSDHFVAVAVMVIAHRPFIRTLEKAVDTLAVRTVEELELTDAILVRCSFNCLLTELCDALG